MVLVHHHCVAVAANADVRRGQQTDVPFSGVNALIQLLAVVEAVLPGRAGQSGRRVQVITEQDMRRNLRERLDLLPGVWTVALLGKSRHGSFGRVEAEQGAQTANWCVPSITMLIGLVKADKVLPSSVAIRRCRSVHSPEVF